jgi:fructose-bisphosphate aldolase class II
MTIASLASVLTPCLHDGTAVAGVVVLGWEDATAYVAAAESEGRPLILQAGPGCRAHTPLAVIGKMFHHLATRASVPVVTHLDHGENLAVCAEAIACGFSSVMFDGSNLPLAENIRQTLEIVNLAHAAGVSVEAELGYVGYADGASSQGTDPADAAIFARKTGVDALAISIGNTHLMTEPGGQIDRTVLAKIQAACPDLPLVLHGGSGISIPLRQALARQTTICKFNIGTELRMAFGAALRKSLADDPEQFDRIKILKSTIPAVTVAARAAIRSLC